MKFKATESELCIINAILQRASVIDEISFLEPYHFYDVNNRDVFAAAQKLYFDEKRVDGQLIANLVKPSIVMEVIDNASSSGGIPANAKAHAKIVFEKWQRRQMLNASAEISHIVKNEPSADNMISECSNVVKRAGTGIESDSSQTLAKVLENCWRELESPPAKPKLVKTGITALDRAIGGLPRGLVTILGARPSMGKSAVAVNIATNAGLMGQDVVIKSLEDTNHFMGLRVLSRQSGVNYGRLVTSTLNTDDFGKIVESMNTIMLDNVLIDDKSRQTTESIRRDCAALKNIDLLVIDHLAELADEDREHASVSKAGRAIRDIAKDFDCAVLLLSQLNRDLEKRADKRPINSDLRGSGTSEQLARVIIFPYRPSVYDENADESEMEIIISKASHGKCGIIKVGVDLSRMRVYDLDDERGY